MVFIDDPTFGITIKPKAQQMPRGWVEDPTPQGLDVQQYGPSAPVNSPLPPVSPAPAPAPVMPRGWVDDPAFGATTPSNLLAPGAGGYFVQPAAQPSMPVGWADDPAFGIQQPPRTSTRMPVGWIDDPAPPVLYEDYADYLPYFQPQEPSWTQPWWESPTSYGVQKANIGIDFEDFFGGIEAGSPRNIFDGRNLIERMGPEMPPGWVDDPAFGIEQPLQPHEVPRGWVDDPAPELRPEHITLNPRWEMPVEPTLMERRLDPNRGGGGLSGMLGDWGGQFKRLWNTADEYAFKPLDYVAELGADATPMFLDLIAPGFTDIYRAGERLEDKHDLPFSNPPDLPTSQAAAQETVGTLQDYRGSVEEFRDRPLAEQLIAGTIFDPTNFLSVPAAVKGVDTARPYLDDAIERSRPFLDEFLQGGERGSVRADLGFGDLFARADEMPIGSPAGVIDDVTEVGPTPRVKPRVAQPDTPEFRSAAQKINDGIAEEIRLRNSGQLEIEKAAGRARQAEGIRELLGQGATAEEARRGAAIGTVFDTAAPKIDLDPAEKAAVDGWLRERWQRGVTREFEYTFLETPAVSKMLNGERLQPRELQRVRELFGDEVADTIALRPKTRVQVEADRLRDLQKAQRQAGIAFEKSVEFKPKTPLQVQKEIETRARQAERAYQDETEQLLREANKALTASDRRQQGIFAAMEKQRVKAIKEAQRAYVAEMNATLRESSEELLRRYKASPEGMASKVRDLVKKGLPNAADNEIQEVSDAIRYWIEGNRMLLDGRGEMQHRALWTMRSKLTGEAADSYVHALLTREQILTDVLTRVMHVDKESARDVARSLIDRELAVRYGTRMEDVVQGSRTVRRGVPQTPENVVDAIKAAREQPGKAAAGLAEIADDMKAFMFGLLDAGMLGINSLASVSTSGLAGMVGLVNKMASIAHMGVPVYDDLAMSKYVRNSLDGLAVRGSKSVIMDTDEVSRTLFRRVPIAGPRLDPHLAKAIEAWTSLQTRLTIEPLRDLVNEGNLVLAHLAGDDISNPATRAIIAERTNAQTLFSRLSPVRGRAAAERAALTSARYRRSQVKNLLYVAKALVDPKATRAERVIAATAITSYAASVLVLGKVTHDLFGADGSEFVWEPWEKGFGNVTLPNGTVVNFFPQQQVIKAIGQSINELAEGDPKEAGEVWARFALGSASPVVQFFGKAAGFGYDPGSGWRLGDYGKNMDKPTRWLNNAPLPPIIGAIKDDGLGLGTLFEFFGVSTFQESEATAYNRKLHNDPRFGKDYYDLEPSQKKAAEEAYGEFPLSRNPETRERQVVSAELRGEQQRAQEADDEAFRNGEMTGEEWRENRSERLNILAAQLDVLYRNQPPKKEKDKSPVDRYYDAINAARKEGEVDWDAVDGWLAALPQADREYIERNTGLNRTDTEREYRQDVDRIAESGYFDLTEGKREFREENPEIADLIRKWGFSKTSVLAEDVTKEFEAQQEYDDGLLRNNDIDAEEWRKRYRGRMDKLSAAKDIIYRGLEDDGEDTDAVDRWFRAIDNSKLPNGEIDWDAVDAWVASQPAADQKEIDAYTGTALTPQVAEYREDVKKIVDSGYWDVRDEVFDYYIQSLGMPSGLIKEDAYWAEVRRQYAIYAEQYLDQAQPGWRAQNPSAAVDLAQTELASQQAKFQNKVTDVNADWREANPEIADLLRKWDYAGGGKKETRSRLGLGED